MKGFIFIGFLDLVEETFGLESVEEIITQSELPSKGIYTSVGTYQFSEMLSLITNLSRNTNISVETRPRNHFPIIIKHWNHSFLEIRDAIQWSGETINFS